MPTVEPAGTALFLKRWLRRPFAMGAVVPSGRLLAEAMARTTLSVMAGRDGHVIELGAGTGEVTKALLAAGIPAGRLALVERDKSSRPSCAATFAGRRSSKAMPRACHACSPPMASSASLPWSPACRCCRCRPRW
jgi:phosphatidylethanolamine/phosphatidyl-N-methylethanolamine N-methyltransferase